MRPTRRASNSTQHDRQLAVDAASTHDTLNHALGNLGGRQPSWMTTIQTPNSAAPDHHHHHHHPAGPPPSKRRRGKPPLSAPTGARIPHHHLQPTGPANPAPEATPDRHPSSNSTSPQLANTLSYPKGNRPLLSPHRVLPSPSPSEDTAAELPPPAPTSMTRNNGALSSTTAALQERAAVDQVPGARAGIPPDVDFTTTESRPSSPDKPAQPTRPMAPSHIAVPSQTSSPSLGHREVQSRPMSRPSSRNQAPGTPQNQSPFGPPRTLSRGGAQNPSTAQQRWATQMHPQAMPPIYAPADYFTQQDCNNAMATFAAQRVKLSEEDLRRYRVLHDAVARQDWHYLFIHQVYCLLTVAPHSLPTTIRSHPCLNAAYEVLRVILHNNESMSHAVQLFFASFPMPIAEIAMHWPHAFQQRQHTFLSFAALSANFSSFKTICGQRRYPPTVREIVFDLGITSPILQIIVFTAIVRYISQAGLPGQTRHKFEEDARSIFEQNQAEFFHRTRPPNTSNEDYDGERNMEAVQWGSQLQHLFSLFDLWVQHTQQPQTHSQRQTNTPLPPSLGMLGPMPTPMNQGRQVYVPQPTHGPGRPRLDSSVPSHAPHTSQNTRPVPTRPPAALPLDQCVLPPRGTVLPLQRVANPQCFALHEANLRSPVLQAKTPNSGLYHYVKNFAKPPTRLTEASQRIEKWSLHISAEDLPSISRDVQAKRIEGEPPSRIVDKNSQALRLRCIKWPSPELPDEHAWATADTAWIPYTYFTFNGTSLNPRRKLYYGKDLPIDLTPLVEAGDNLLEIAVVRQAKDNTYLNYLLAIERISITTHSSIKGTSLTENIIPAADILAAIRRKLTARNSGDDDDVQIENCSLTISLVDPISVSSICDIPARSRACLHSDCFDLETFLRTRKRVNDVAVSDVWRCPICMADARPQFLIVDGFLQDVRRQLEVRGILSTREIIVGQDGAWEPKAAIEVIELDSD